ncbi:peptidoglycan/xylan/chitin deacetylase (PgdA/CDA1 family) [Brevibacterium sanguinis]|uniref:Peptidoglycan/xylan/chitin deacetylase (PgdA/CDA1 family) n=3 Tax=Brevibacteriaceae TaxID=85019 RepID=A0A366IL49_9MICO|nr:peptidoglycan/xylan/chitin deacetylase (PgdA/CDA1 family) [Brevibacterium sanguinis]RBP72948.1 peptidoglycan/xylan/chitin deacetylase (PgdA/CDA1 family) [Brevibacterium celere]
MVVAAALALTLSGCVATGTSRDSAGTTRAGEQIAADNLGAVRSILRTYAIVDEEFAPHVTAHLFGVPGLASLSSAVEAEVLAAIEAAGSFGDRAAYSPVLTDPSLRRAPAEFIATGPGPGTTGTDPRLAEATGAPTETPAEATGSPTGGPGAEAGLEIANEVLAAGGDFLVSRLRVAGVDDPAGTVSVFVTDLAADTTVDAQDLLGATVDPAAIGVDAAGTLTVDGSPVGRERLSAQGDAVVRALRTPVALPADADERSPDYSCSLLPCVALTYDDGPGEADVENALLDAAAEAKVRVTYFLLGKNAAAFPGTVERMVASGHEIANHTHTHPQLDRTSASTVTTQVRQADDAIESAGAGRPQLMRPPYGALDASAARALGHPAILWDVDTEDWRHRNAEKVVDSVARETGPGSVVLMHSIHPSTVEAAPEVFAAVADKGLYAVTVSELFAGVEFTDGARYYCRGYADELCSNPEHPAVLGS